MGTTQLTTSELGDAELITEVRAGDIEAYGVLFGRHVDAARRLARQLAPAADVDDLVSDAFAKVLAVLQRGAGPDLAFRAYLLTTLRRLHVDRHRATARTRPTDDVAALDPGVPFHDTVVEEFEHATAARAFGSLPERWQAVLWHVEVEGMRPAQVAPLLAISANSVSALVYRAREGLRQAYLAQHAQDAEDETCARIRDLLGSYLRGSCSPRDADRVESHLALCRPCTAVTVELAEVNAHLRAILAPLVLGAWATAYLEAGGSGAVEAGAAATADSTADGTADPVRAGGSASTPAAVVGLVAALVVVGGLLSLTFASPDDDLPGRADAPSVAAPDGLSPPSPRPDPDAGSPPPARQSAARTSSTPTGATASLPSPGPPATPSRRSGPPPRHRPRHRARRPTPRRTPRPPTSPSPRALRSRSPTRARTSPLSASGTTLGRLPWSVDVAVEDSRCAPT